MSFSTHASSPASLRSLTLKIGFALAVIATCWLGQATAEPLDLNNAEPRGLVVAFEVSPREVPDRINTTYTRDFPANLEPGDRDGEIRVVIAAQIIEQYLFGAEDPVPGSFSDFVWTFDIETGHVISATVRGRVSRKLDWGIVTTHAKADIEVEMGTARTAGFNTPTRILGQLFFRHCTVRTRRGCTLVEATPFDPTTGYVNAIGGMWVHSYAMNLYSFSPLGEAVFRELNPPVEAQMAMDETPAEEFSQTDLSLPLGRPADNREDLRPGELN